jgi:Uma2 family endonuclease
MDPKSKRLPIDNVDELIEALGGVAPHRVRLKPSSGTATEDDLIRVRYETGEVCELVVGTLVRKELGWEEHLAARRLGELISDHVKVNDLGVVGGLGHGVRLGGGVVRFPDVSFIAKRRLSPGFEWAAYTIIDLHPDLAVGVVSEETARELSLKRRDYLDAGTPVVWEVDPVRRVIDVYTDSGARTALTGSDTLDGGAVLTGFKVCLAELFGWRPPIKPRPRRKKK